MAIDPNWVRENPEEAARQIELLTIERDQYRAAEEAQIAQRQKIQERVEELECQVEEAGRRLRNPPRNNKRETSEYPPCDYCGAIPETHPWHGSGLLNGKDSPHIHACSGCRNKLPSSPCRELIQHAEALEEAAKETVPAMHKMSNWLIARAAEKRCQAEGGA